MARRNFSNSASVGSIVDVLNNTDVSATYTLDAGLTSWPATPCTAAINLGAADEEVVLVTAVSGTSVTLTRGYDSSTTRSHTTGATLTHVSASIDFNEANTHVNASTGVHGLTGAVVGTTDTQTLSSKTLTAPAITDFHNAAHDHSALIAGGSIPQSSVTGLVTALAAKATDAGVVHATGTESIAGAKTFSATLAASGNATVGGTLGVTGASTLAAVTATSVAASTTLTVGGQNAMSVAVGDAIIASGQPTITTDGSGRVTINYGHTFTDVPVVMVTTNTTNDARQLVNVVGRNTSQFVAEVYHDTAPATGVTLIINWIAIGS